MWSTAVLVLLASDLTVLFAYYDDYYVVPGENSTSDCHQEFHSSHKKSGTLSSPLYPAPYSRGKRCHYVFQGKGKERVQITFEDLELNYDTTSTTGTNCEDEDSVVVSIKVEGKSSDIGRYCGNKKADMLMSSDTRMDVLFITRDRPNSARGFKATYKFVTDFGIKHGVQSEQLVCGFEFKSLDYNNGTFTSPNYPGLYPRNTECEYIFYGEEHELVHIEFPFFDVEGVPPHCDDKSSSDYLEFSNFNIVDRKMSRFCGMREGESGRGVDSDGPFFKVLFKSNGKYDARGFEAHYQFKRGHGNGIPGPKPSTPPPGGAAISQHFAGSSSLTNNLLCLVLSVLLTMLNSYS